MRRHSWLISGGKSSFLLLAYFCFGVARAGDYLSLVTEYSPPNNMMVQGEEVGAATDVVRAILSQAQIEYIVKEYPWRRAYHEALVHSNTCIYSTIMTDQRKPLFKWVGPILRDVWVAFGIETNRAAIATLDQLYAYRLGTSLGSARSAFLSENNLMPVEALTDELNIKMLENGRIDFWITSQSRGDYFIRRHQIGNMRAMFVLNPVEYYLACNKDTPSTLIDKLNAAIKLLGLDREQAVAATHKWAMLR